MGFVFRKRINLGSGFGINLSKSGFSSSLRTKGGTIGSKGYSVRTGIPGIYYRGAYRKGGCASILLVLIIVGGVIFSNFLNSCSGGGQNAGESPKTNQTQIKVIYEKKFGKTHIFMCLIADSNWVKIEEDCKELIKSAEIGFVYCYDDSSKIKNINKYNNALDAFPEEKVDYVCELIKRPGDPMEFNKVIENYKRQESKGDISKVKLILIDKKERISRGRITAKYRWYVFYVDNYYNNNEVFEMMKQEALKLPVDDPNSKVPSSKKTGFTEVFFFNTKENAPKLAADGGWGMKESANSMDKKYGKFLVGHISMGAGEDFYFSKGF